MPSRRRSVVPLPTRRAPRFQLDVDWFVESNGAASLGRGLELSLRGALLPASCCSPFTDGVTLYLSLPARERMFKARCIAEMKAGRGWVLHFTEIAPDDLQVLGHTLVSQFGAAALPLLERRAPVQLEM